MSKNYSLTPLAGRRKNASISFETSAFVADVKVTNL